MATTTNVSNLKINVLTKEQYDAATKDENQLYLITNNTTEFLALTGGTLTGELILAADPTENLGAATKQYVDNSVPTKVSDLTNDSGFTSNTGTITAVQANGTDVATSGTANIPAASTSVYGVTKLSSATNSTSTDLAATASAVKSAYDLANGKADASHTHTVSEITDLTVLPQVTATDNGKILRVVDGIWAAATLANAEEATF